MLNIVSGFGKLFLFWVFFFFTSLKEVLWLHYNDPLEKPTQIDDMDWLCTVYTLCVCVRSLFAASGNLLQSLTFRI